MIIKCFLNGAIYPHPFRLHCIMFTNIITYSNNIFFIENESPSHSYRQFLLSPLIQAIMSSIVAGMM